MAEKERARKSWATTGKNGREKSWASDLESFDFKEHKDKYIKVRLVTESLTEKLHWVYLDVKNAIKHARGEKLNYKQAPSFPVICPDFDPLKETGTPNKCPICVHFGSHTKPSFSYYCFAYVSVPSKKKGGTDRWLEDPVLLKLGQAIVIGIQNIITLKGSVDPADPVEGYYVNIMAKSNPSGPNDAYVVQAGEAMKLSKDQRSAVKQLPDLFELYKPTSAAAIKDSLTQKGYYELLDEDGHSGEDEDDDDEEVGSKKKKGKGKEKPSSKKKSSKHDDDEDEDEDEDSDNDSDDDEDEDDEDEKKPSKKKYGKKSKSRYDDEDEDEDEDEDSDDDDSDDEDDDEDEDEDEKKSSKSKKKSGKKSSKYDDDDEDEDEDDEEKPSKKKSGKKSSKHDEDEDDDDDEDEDDDDDDIPAPKNSSMAKKKKSSEVKGKKKKR